MKKFIIVAACMLASLFTIAQDNYTSMLIGGLVWDSDWQHRQPIKYDKVKIRVYQNTIGFFHGDKNIICKTIGNGIKKTEDGYDMIKWFAVDSKGRDCQIMFVSKKYSALTEVEIIYPGTGVGLYIFFDITKSY